MPVRAHAPLLSATCPVTGLAGPGARDCPQERGVSRSCEGSFDQRVSEAAPATVGGFSMATVASPWEDRVRADRQTDRQEGHHHAPAGGRGESSEHEAEAGVESGGELEPWTGRGGASCDGVACCAVGAGSRRPRLRSGATFSLCRRYRVITARWLPVTSVAFQPGFESRL